MQNPEPELFPVAIGAYLDQAWGVLDVVTEVEEMARVLGDFGVRLVPWDVPLDARTREQVIERLAHWSDPTASHNSVLYWAGHGDSNATAAALATRETVADRALATGLGPAELATFIAERGSHVEPHPWCFVVIDACKSSRFVELVAGHIQLSHRGTRGVLIFGVSGGATLLGEFRLALQRCLANTYHANDEILLADLGGQLERELHGSYATSLGLADARLSRSTPRAAPGTPLDVAREIEEMVAGLSPHEQRHFIPKGRGGDANEVTWYFEGRLAEQRRIAEWLQTTDRGLLVVTGAPGSGKSALLGFLLAQSRPQLRQILVRHQLIADLPKEDRPADDVFQVALLLTGMSPTSLIRAIGAAAGLADPPVVENLEWSTQWLTEGLNRQPSPLTLLLDGLDEAEQPSAVAELLGLLTQTVRLRMIVGTRRSLVEGPDLPVSLGDRQNLVNALGAVDRQVLIQRDPEAIYRYVRRRLGALPTAQSAARDIAAVDHEFLFARLMVHEILARPDLLTSARPELDRLLSGSHRDVFIAAVARLSTMAAHNESLLQALGYARGRGVPIRDGIWTAVGTALTAGRRVDDATSSGAGGNAIDAPAVHSLLEQAAPYIMLDIEDNQTVYRLAHRTFAEHFTTDQDPAVVAANNDRIIAALTALTPPANNNPYVNRHVNAPIRIVAAYATGYRYIDRGRSELRRKFRLGQPGQAAPIDLDDNENDQRQLPNWLPVGPITPADLTLPEPTPGVVVRAIDTLLFVLPSDQIVLAVVLDLDTALLDGRGGAGPLDGDELARRSAAVIDQCAASDLLIKGMSMPDYLHRLVAPVPEIVAYGTEVLLPERHQLVFVRRLHQTEQPPSPQAVHEILDRGNSLRLPAAALRADRPEDLNRSPLTMAAVTVHLSVLYGHDGYVEDAVLLSAVYAVGAAARFRQIWQQAHDQVLHFNRYYRRSDRRQSRSDYEELADHLGNLEFDLTFSVESPARRIDSYDAALYRALNLSAQAAALGQTFRQSGGSLAFSSAALDIQEKQEAQRNPWRAVALGVVATIAVPTSVLLEFFATNTIPGQSMLDGDNTVYLVAALFALIPLAMTLAVLSSAWPWLARLRRTTVRLSRRTHQKSE